MKREQQRQVKPDRTYIAKDIARDASEGTGLTLGKMEEIVGKVFSSIRDRLEIGNRVNIGGFGAFDVYARVSRGAKRFVKADGSSVKSRTITLKFTPSEAVKKQLRLLQEEFNEQFEEYE